MDYLVTSAIDSEHTISREGTLVESRTTKATKIRDLVANGNSNEADHSRESYRIDICDHDQAYMNISDIPE
jgi:hypothetical protein